jgi:putative thioredoxin
VSDPHTIQSGQTAQARAAHAGPEQDMSHVDAHGAVDLTAGTGAQQTEQDDAATVRIDVPLIAQSDEQGFNDVVSTSRTVPVVAVLWSPRTLNARAALDVLEGVAREYAGRFQLVEIDADASPSIVQAFQAQSLPTVVALVAGRPVPMFQGSALKEQITPVIDELLQVAQQMGVTGAVAVTARDTEKPTPEDHLPALAAEEAGDLEGAIAAWENAIEHNPRDEDAKAHLARVRIAARRSRPSSGDDRAAQADAAFEAGDQEGAFDLLLGIIAESRDPDQRENARVRLLDLFRVAGNTDAVRSARRRLSTLLLA